MATLQHGDQTTVFYGTNAFLDAYNAAADTLDVITLSPGTFYVPMTIGRFPIEKSVTIFGAGFEDDPLTNTGKTELSFGFDLRRDGIHLEGVMIESINLKTIDGESPRSGVTIAKCKSQFVTFNISFASDETIRLSASDVTIRQCVIECGIVGGSGALVNNLLITNCYIGTSIDGFDTDSEITINNCLIRNDQAPYYNENQPFVYRNSILYKELNDYASAYSCIFIGCASGKLLGLDENIYANVLPRQVFVDENEDGYYAPEKTFEVRKYLRSIEIEEASEGRELLGTDGTPIGLYGGQYSWNKIPSIPRILDSNIDIENSEDGILKVSIKAESQEEGISAYEYWFNRAPRARIVTDGQKTLEIQNMEIALTDIIPNVIPDDYTFDVERKMVYVEDDVVFGQQVFDDKNRGSMAVCDTFQHTVSVDPHFVLLAENEKERFDTPTDGLIRGFVCEGTPGNSVFFVVDGCDVKLDLYDAEGNRMECQLMASNRKKTHQWNVYSENATVYGAQLTTPIFYALMYGAESVVMDNSITMLTDNPLIPTGLRTIDDGWRISTERGMILVQTEQSELVSIASVGGNLLVRGKTRSGLNAFEVPPGVYVVCVGDLPTQKLVVR